jgi:protein-tyrosine phosphatase
MDDENFDAVSSMNPGGRARVVRMCEFASDRSVSEVPDPYYGGDAGFERVLDILEDTCANLLKEKSVP